MSIVIGTNGRKFQKVETNMPVTLELGVSRMDALILSVTADGCLVESSSQIRPSEILTLSFGRQSAPIVFRAKVQSCVPKGKVFHYRTCFSAGDEKAKAELLKSLVQVANLYKPKEEVKTQAGEATPESEAKAKAGGEAPPSGTPV